MKNDFFDNVLAAVMFLLLLLLLFPLLPFFLIALLLAGAPAHTINQAPHGTKQFPRPHHRNHNRVTVLVKKNGKTRVWRT